MTLFAKQQNFIESEDRHLLLIGGPGAGKTTISIHKAKNIIKNGKLLSEQKILFLSFARPTVARIVETINAKDKSLHKFVEINTYHAFFWQIIKTYGYLVGLPRKLFILLPHDEAILLSDIRSMNLSEDEKKLREYKKILEIANTQGQVAFSLFAQYVKQILGCKKILKQISNTYPFIVLDEFQDTNAGQWENMKLLGQTSILLALADPEQRIYDFAGADPARIQHYKEHFNPMEFNLGTTNYRSSGTDIALFGKEVLSGQFSKREYKGLVFNYFPPNEIQSLSQLKFYVLERIRDLTKHKTNWTLAILVPTKNKMQQVSDYLLKNKPYIHHTAMIDTEGVLLAAELTAFLLQPPQEKSFDRLIELLCGFFQGKNGSKITKKDIKKAKKLQISLPLFSANECKKNDNINLTYLTYNSINNINLTGSPEQDWSAVSDSMEKGECELLKEVALEVKNIRLLKRGKFVREALANSWKNNSCYHNAVDIVRLSFQQEHLAVSSEEPRGVFIMNIHKSKGKEFDEVILFEGHNKYKDRFVIKNDKKNINSSTKQLFMTGITRSKKQTTIMSPNNDPCVLCI
ncbi:MAG: ATP-dependent helicase [Endomicrobiaceae bacterium]|nr:ATP-dependent helicase [Endomicrobiaceae bacterium]